MVFPLELRLFNTSDDAVNPDRMYDLVAVVIHCGSGPNRGHYISIVKSHGFWLIFDDDIVDKIDPATIEDFYGLTSQVLWKYLSIDHSQFHLLGYSLHLLAQGNPDVSRKRIKTNYLYVFGRKVMMDGAAMYFDDGCVGHILHFGFVPNLEHHRFLSSWRSTR